MLHSLIQLIVCSPLCRCSEHAQHRHPVVSHLELGLCRQHTEAEEQAERTANQLHSVFAAAPGEQKLHLKEVTGRQLAVRVHVSSVCASSR